jgi:hypothetical protein
MTLSKRKPKRKRVDSEDDDEFIPSPPKRQRSPAQRKAISRKKRTHAESELELQQNMIQKQQARQNRYVDLISSFRLNF